MKQNITKWIREQARTAWATVFDNPVVLRDLRAQMRGTKSYWFIGTYLLLLSVLAVAGYAQATHQGMGAAGTDVPFNIVDAQGHLSEMYIFIFGTIAALIVLIAPALTAASIVGERQRLSFDLLVTTPLKASELLAGKLISSIAFLGLLLALSMPAAALCVILGGATLADVLRTYAQLAVDGTVLAAIGLFFSCAARTNLLAVIWSYATVGALVFLTCSLGSQVQGMSVMYDSPLTAFVALNPIMAVMLSGGMAMGMGHSVSLSVTLFGLSIPVLLVSAAFAFLAIRLCVTASTYRLGVYGAQSASSMRRQVLAITGIAAFLFGQMFFRAAAMANWSSNYQAENSGFMDWLATHSTGFVVFLMGGFLVGGAFLPALFVPASRDEDLPGALHQQIAGDTSLFRFRKAFQPVHSGAFPFFTLWLASLTTGAFAAFAIALQQGGGLHVSSLGFLMSFVLLGVTYIGGLGFLLWQISRFAGAAVKTIAGARGLSFGIFALLSAAPLMAMALSNSQHPEKTAFAMFTFLFYPLMVTQASPTLLCAGMREALLTTTVLSLALGLVFAMLRKGIAARAERHSNALAQAIA